MRRGSIRILGGGLAAAAAAIAASGCGSGIATPKIPRSGPPRLDLSLGCAAPGGKYRPRTDARVGATVRCRVRIVNSGRTTTTALRLFDHLPSGLRYVTGSAHVRDVLRADRSRPVSRGLFGVEGAGFPKLASGGTLDVTYRVRVATPGSLRNVASLTSRHTSRQSATAVVRGS